MLLISKKRGACIVTKIVHGVASAAPGYSRKSRRLLIKNHTTVSRDFEGGEERGNRPVSRVLSRTVIPLRRLSPDACSDLPRSRADHT